jgi:tetratricopeptide (TPR) repeat protein
MPRGHPRHSLTIQVWAKLLLHTLGGTKLSTATMRLNPLIVALLLNLPVGAQIQHPVPDAPQPQKNAQPKPEAPTKPATDDNAFPESTSQAAAEKAKPTTDDNAFPEATSKAAAEKATQTPATPKPSDDNPFPESVSKAAAKAADDTKEDTPEQPNLPSGVSSSSSSSLQRQLAPQLDPDRSKKDTEVGDLYLKSRNYQGALLRFQDATRSDPTNVTAIFGLAETQRSLGKNTEAATNYQMYLDILPNGPRSKDAMKALKTLHR